MIFHQLVPHKIGFFLFLMLIAERKTKRLFDTYRKVVWNVQSFATWFAHGQTFGRFVILRDRRNFCGVILELQAGHFWQKCSVLRTEKSFDVFLGGESIGQYNGKRQRQKETEDLHFVLSLNKWAEFDKDVYLPRAFSALNTNFCLSDLLYH